MKDILLGGEGFGSSKWLLLMPRAAFIAFVISLSTLLWFSHQQDIDEQRATLISDMLWLEQNLRFQMVRNEELLGHISGPVTAATPSFDTLVRPLLANNSGLKQILLLDLASGKLLGHPVLTDSQLVGEAQGAVPSPTMLKLVQSLGTPAYAAPYPIVGNDWQLEVHVPIFRHGRTAAIAIGIYSLNRMIEESVPWWLAERYRIAVIDGNASVLSARTKITPLRSNASYQLPFDPPGYGLLLSATPYVAPFRLIDRLLVIAVVLLALATLISIWMVRKYFLQRLRAESALRKEYLFRQAMERSVQTGMRARDMEGRILYVNDAFCRMVGWPAEELVGRAPPMPYWPENQREEIQAVHDRVLAGEGPTEGFELSFRRRSGESFTALIHEAPLIDANGQQTGWMGSVLDISDRKAAEDEKIRQQERIQATARLVAMGEMASGLAHELNQPLAAISSYCSGALRLLRERRTDDDIAGALAKAVEQTQRAAQVIRRIYALAKRESSSAEPLELGASLRSALGLVDTVIKRQEIRIIDDCDTANPVIRGDAVLIEQVLFNLLRNAADAMQETALEQRSITITLQEADGYALLSIADRGRGIDPQTAARIFDPLFTTKEDGMGMGLAISRSIVEGHRGRLWFEENPGGGTVFHVRLPLHRP